MTALTLSRIWRGRLALVVLSGMPALAGVVYVGTNINLDAWQVWAAASGWQTPMHAVNASVSPDVRFEDWVMSLSSDGGSWGTLIPKFDPAGWNGVWLAHMAFYLPSMFIMTPGFPCPNRTYSG